MHRGTDGRYVVNNLLVLVFAFSMLLAAIAISIVALLLNRRWLHWRTRAQAAERDSSNARRAANTHLAHAKHWQAAAYQAWSELRRAGLTEAAAPPPPNPAAITTRLPAIAGQPAPQWKDQVT